MDCSQSGSSVLGNSLGKNTGVGCHAVLQRIFPTLGSNPGFPHCRKILYQLSHQGSPRILEWTAYPFSRGSSWPRNRTRSPVLQVDSLSAELPGKPCEMIPHCNFVLHFLIVSESFPVAQQWIHLQCRRHSYIPGWRRSPGEGNGSPLQYSCLGNPMDRGVWQATVHEVTRVGHCLVTKSPPPQ